MIQEMLDKREKRYEEQSHVMKRKQSSWAAIKKKKAREQEGWSSEKCTKSPWDQGYG